ncbi:MAG: glycerophosphodiester phosphodiesterase family protein [Ferruginibacter sp.]
MKYIILIAIAITACSPHKNKSINMLDKQGHRGCRSLLPENTTVAMIKAIELGVNTIEMDVVITKDREVILSHEPFFNHEISSKPGGEYVSEREERSLNIFRMTYEETTKYDVGLKPHPRFPGQQKIRSTKPLLKDVFDSVENYCRSNKITPVHYNIETKTQPATDGIYHPDPQQFVDLVMEVILKKGIEKRVIIQSFDFRTLVYTHNKYPAIRTAMLIEDSDKRSIEDQLQSMLFIPSIYSPHYSLLSIELIKKCHDKKMLVIPWTVNSADKIKELYKMGVDGIIIDDPQLFINLTAKSRRP